MIRAKLMVSELAEVLDALANRDEEELADGLADLEYVTIGTACTYMIPLGAVFDEVHRSNMTKDTASEAVANHSGNKGKGPNYSPPSIAEAIVRGRTGSEVGYPRRYNRGDRMCTRDGRRIGNAVVVDREQTVDGKVYYHVLTDFGNNAKFSPREMMQLYYPEPRKSDMEGV